MTLNDSSFSNIAAFNPQFPRVFRGAFDLYRRLRV